MPELVGYRLENAIATITMDDGKVNALSPRMIDAIRQAFGRAEADGAVVVLTGRAGIFSAGFDLGVMRAAGAETAAMIRAGFELAERVLSFPRPVVIACPGHAIAMGVFLVLSGDYRIGAQGAYRIVANEVAIGLTMPRPAVEILKHRLSPTCFGRATLLSETFSPEAAIAAGFLDRVVAPDALPATAREVAAQLATLDAAAHRETKLRARVETLERIRSGIEADAADFAEALARA
jgi:enoyl-CoA hydratase